MNKKTLVNNFSRNARTYEEFASVQKQCARDLLQIIPFSDCENILEIGCGTGFYTHMLTRKFSCANITSVDISDSMIDIAKKRCKENKVSFLRANIEELQLEQKFEVITSNVSLQWVENLNRLVRVLAQGTINKGVMAISMYGPETFRELKHVLSVLYGENKWLSSSSFKGKDRMGNIMRQHFSSVDIWEHNIQVVYPDIWTYFYSIKRTGTRGDGIGKFVHLTKNRILEIEKRYLALYGKIVATHNVFFCKGIKK